MVYWALLLFAFFALRGPRESALILVRGSSVPESTAVVSFLPPDLPVSIQRSSVQQRKVPVRKSGVHFTGSAIYLNSADEAELCKIKGIGPVLAGRIVQYRKDNGKFSSIEELEGVKGIGPKTVAKLKSQAIRVGR